MASASWWCVVVEAIPGGGLCGHRRAKKIYTPSAWRFPALQTDAPNMSVPPPSEPAVGISDCQTFSELVDPFYHLGEPSGFFRKMK